MTRENRCRETTFGYLSALESLEHGFFGGYLLISLRGRPLEFHCTAPVRPNRAQQILYGPMLHPYLLGEQIGGALVREAAIVPQLILTDQVAVLSLRSQIETPIVYVLNVGGSAGPANRPGQGDIAPAESASSGEGSEHAGISGRFQLHGHACELAPGYESDCELVLKPLAELVQYVELVEPFDRIHEAIREAQRIGGEGPEVHGQAA
jgi:hypothetical protein